MAMALTGKIAPYKRGFGPMPGGVHHLPFPVAHLGIGVDDSLRALDQLFRADVAPDDVAAIIIEPVQGEGGFHRSEEHTSELQSLMRISYAVFCLKKKQSTARKSQYRNEKNR